MIKISEQQQNSNLALYNYKEEGGYGAISLKINPVDLVVSICDDYGLDPRYNEILLIRTKLGPKPYITAAGLRKATTGIIKKLDSKCIDSDKTNFPPKWVTYRTEIETIDDRFFSAEGSYELSEHKGGGPITLHLMKSKAETRAVSRAMRYLLAKPLDIFDDLPDDVKKNTMKIDPHYYDKPEEFKEVVMEEKPKPVDVNWTEDITDDILNMDLSEEDSLSSIPVYEVKESKKSELDQLLDFDLDILGEPTKPKPKEIEPIIAITEKIDLSNEGFEGMDYLIPFIKTLKENVKNETPTIDSFLEVLKKKDGTTKYLWDSFRVMASNGYFDFLISEGKDAKKTSPPIMLYEQFTKSLLTLVENPNAKRWYELVKESEQDTLAAYIFYLIYVVYINHKVGDVKEFPSKTIINRISPSGIVRKWLVDKVFNSKEMYEVEFPD